jgi:hypothetical protein
VTFSSDALHTYNFETRVWTELIYATKKPDRPQRIIPLSTFGYERMSLVPTAPTATVVAAKGKRKILSIDSGSKARLPISRYVLLDTFPLHRKPISMRGDHCPRFSIDANPSLPIGTNDGMDICKEATRIIPPMTKPADYKFPYFTEPPRYDIPNSGLLSAMPTRGTTPLQERNHYEVQASVLD